MGASEGSNWDFIKGSHYLFQDKRPVKQTVLHASQIYFGSKKHRGYSSRSPWWSPCQSPYHYGRGDWTVLTLHTAFKVCSCWTGIMWYYHLCQQEETVSLFEEMGSTLYLIKEKKFSTATVLYWPALSWLISEMWSGFCDIKHQGKCKQLQNNWKIGY